MEAQTTIPEPGQVALPVNIACRQVTAAQVPTQCRNRLLPALALLLAHELVHVAHALALVRLRRPPRADLGRKVTHPRLIVACDDHCRVLLHRDFDVLGNLDHHRVAVPQVERQIAAGQLRAVADTDEGQGLGEAREVGGFGTVWELAPLLPGGMRC